MAETIWKFPVAVGDGSVRVPAGAEFLSAQMQGGTLTLWAIVDPDAQEERIPLRILGTGIPIYPDQLSGMRHLDTVQAGQFVWHVFVGETR